MYMTKIDLKRNVSFELGGQEITITHKEALDLAEAIYDSELQDRIHIELAKHGITEPDYDEDERGCIAFGQHETELTMECPTFKELIQREAAAVVEKYHPLG